MNYHTSQSHLFETIDTRDTNSSPDLGYHYDPIDYFFGGVTANSNVTFTAGTAGGWFELPGSGGPGYGITLKKGIVATFNGTATSPCVFARYDTVQEGGCLLWTNKGWLGGMENGGSYDTNNPAGITAAFTHFSHLAGDPGHFRDGTNNQPIVVQAKDCEFYGGAVGRNMLAGYTNCLFYRAGFGISNALAYPYQIYINCTFYGGSLGFGHSERGAPYWYSYIHDCAFDNTTFSIGYPFGSNTNYADYNYNAFNSGAVQPPTEGANTVSVTGGFNWQTNWFGNYYLPPNSLLIDAGDRTAARAGLYEFTTQTSQVKEGDSVVDIGYHYVAVDYNGNPLETFTNNAPDYLVDASGNGLPDWWEMYWFGNLTHSGSDVDGNDYTLLYDYLTSLNPSTIGFTVQFPNLNVNVTNATGSFVVMAGYPSYEAVLVNNTNLNDAVWTNYDGIVHVNLGPTDGVYQVWMGLKGFATNAQPVWIGTRVTLNRAKPQIFITSPVTNVVAQPYLQLKGYSVLPLAGVTFDVSNAVAVVTNQSGSITGHFIDTNTLSYTTDYFQCFDIPLAAGTNAITLHATDPAGNSTNIAINIMLDYTTSTNPVIQLTWPTNGMEICGSSFTLRGWTEDSSAQVTVQITDSNGNTNVVSGMVERTGVLWVQNLPLAGGTNYMTLTVINAAGLSSTNSIAVVKSDMTLTLTSIDGDLWLPAVNVSGTISDPTAAIWVNGKQGTNYGNGYWKADNVPVPSGGVASFDVNAIPAGGDDPWYSFILNKADEVVMDSAIWGGGYARIGVDYEVNHITGYYTFKGGGVYHGHQEDVLGSDYTQDDLFIVLGPGGPTGGLGNEYVGVEAYDYYEYDGDGDFWDDGPGMPVFIAPEGGSLSVGPQDGYLSQNRYSQTSWTFLKGGLFAAGQQMLVAAGVSMLEELAKPAFTTRNTTYISDGQISIGEVGQAGNDGMAYKVTAAGSAVVVTPTASGVPMQTWATIGAWAHVSSLGANAYVAQIRVNDSVTLDPGVVVNGADFCVGQYLDFNISGFSWLTDEAANWTLPGTFVNRKPDINCDAYYDEDKSLLTRLYARDGTLATHCWYVLDSQQATVSVKFFFYDPHGVLQIIPITGKFNVHRPAIVDTDEYPDGNPTPQISPDGNYLSLGDNNRHNDMSFRHRILPGNFSGDAGYIQLVGFGNDHVHSYCSWHFPNNIDLSPNNNLDTLGGTDFARPTTQIPASLSLPFLPPTATWTDPPLYDGPFVFLADNATHSYQHLHFHDYLMFKPQDSSGGPSIYVTLQRIDWELNQEGWRDFHLDPSSAARITSNILSSEFPHWNGVANPDVNQPE